MAGLLAALRGGYVALGRTRKVPAAPPHPVEEALPAEADLHEEAARAQGTPGYEAAVADLGSALWRTSGASVYWPRWRSGTSSDDAVDRRPCPNAKDRPGLDRGRPANENGEESRKV